MGRFKLDLDGVTLSLEQLSESGKPRLLCLHGGPGLDRRSLRGIESLKEIFDIILIDLRGHGESSVPNDGDYSLNAYAHDIVQVAKCIRGGSGIGILGHSFGGLVTAQVMAENTEIFDFGILCCSPLDASYQATAGDAIKKHVTDIDPDEIEKSFAKDPNNDQSYASLMMGYGPMYFPNISRPEIEKIMESWSIRVAPYNYAEKSIFPEIDLKPLCPKIEVPVLVIGAKNDDLIPVDHVAGFKKHLNRCELRYVAGGHFPFTTHPEEFLTTVSQWWDSKRKEIAL